ncbi:hypothetical protein Peur_063055 [Populus x canadensis]
MAGKKASGRDDENAAVGGGGKSRKKGLVIGNDHQYSIGTDQLSEKKGNHEGEEGEDEQVPEVVLVAGKKKLKGRKSSAGGNTGFNWSNFGLLGGGDEDDNDGDDEEISELTGEKDSEEEEDEPVVSFKGKKKGKGNKKSGGGGGSVFSASGFDATDDGENDGEVMDKDGDDDDDVPGIEFTGQKKKSSKGGKKVAGRFSSKSNKKSGNNKFSAALLDEKSEDQVEETLKHEKKKKNKSARDAQEEDDLNKILAELGNAPPTSKSLAPPPQEEKPNLQPEPVSVPDSVSEKEGEDEKEESAAAKKRKKKKKEKEKEKKAAAKEERLEEEKAETSKPKKTDAKGKGAEKKLPKHVREMQEALARRKEMEERKAREEEDKRRKEEEERLRQEELERQVEEARRRKKEREKERLQKKKQEGKLLTGKQKEEQRRLESMRYQILANATITVPNAERDGGPTRRPRYQTRRSRPVHDQANGIRIEEPVEAKEKEQEEEEVVHEVESLELENFEPVEEEKTEVANVLVEDGMEEDDDDEEWDAKSWDDVNFNVKGAFDDDEDSEPEPVLKKETKAPLAAAQPAIAVRKPVTSQAMDSHDVEDKKSQAEVEVSDKNRKKDAAATSKGAVSDAIPHKGEETLRSPICCVMGHVDTGKTKLLDYIRGTHVQEGEARGITQQIGATFFPVENIRDRTKELKADARLNVPGLLVIDTPGHESFTNLRSHGSGLCDIAILVVNIMHGLEPQTIESLNLLRKRNTEFIVALNKIDRLYGWKTQPNAPIRKALKQQSKDVQNEFDRRLIEVITQLKEQGLNTELYYKNKDMGETFNIVPTSAISGEGIPDLLLLLIQWSQKTMVEKLTFRNECTVLEVKVTKGHGTTIDVVLVNGVLHEGDQIVFCSLQASSKLSLSRRFVDLLVSELLIIYFASQGPIVTTIRALLTPHPMQELRVKGTYLHHKEIKAAQGIKITGQGLEHAIAGTSLYVVRRDDDLEEVKESAMQDMKSVTSRIDRSGEGVGTPVCVLQKDFTDIGRIASIRFNEKAVDHAKKGQKVTIKIVGTNPEEQQKMHGRHFDNDDQLVSHITRRSIDVLKAYYRDDLSMEDWKLVLKLKTLFKIQ